LFAQGRGNTEGVGNSALGCGAMIYARQVRASLRAASAVEAEALTVGGAVLVLERLIIPLSQ